MTGPQPARKARTVRLLLGPSQAANLTRAPRRSTRATAKLLKKGRRGLLQHRRLLRLRPRIFCFVSRDRVHTILDGGLEGARPGDYGSSHFAMLLLRPPPALRIATSAGSFRTRPSP